MGPADKQAPLLTPSFVKGKERKTKIFHLLLLFLIATIPKNQELNSNLYVGAGTTLSPSVHQQEAKREVELGFELGQHDMGCRCSKLHPKVSNQWKFPPDRCLKRPPTDSDPPSLNQQNTVISLITYHILRSYGYRFPAQNPLLIHSPANTSGRVM